MGGWTSVTAPAGLPGGYSFVYDSATETLSIAVLEVDTTAPAAPASLLATAGDSAVSLNWSDNSESDLSGYHVYRSTTSGAGYSLIGNSAAISSYTDYTAVNGITYYYVVTAVDLTGNASGYSVEAAATPQDSTAPAAPGSLLATAGDGSVSLDWSDNNEPDLGGYHVYRSTTSGGGYSLVGNSGATSAYNDASVVNGLTYYYVVAAVDLVGNASGYSGEANATPLDTTAPAVPVSLVAVAGDSTVSLDWADNNEPDLGSYHVLRSTTSGAGYTLVGNSGSISNYADHTAVNGVTYYYVVTAVDSVGNTSDYSSEASATPQDTTAPAAPLSLLAVAGDSSVSLDWSDNNEPDLGGYNVYRSTTSGGAYSLLGSSAATSAYEDGSAVNGITYHYVVTAVDFVGNASAYSSEAAATPVPAATDFMGQTQSGAADNLISTAQNWSNGLPVGRQGFVTINAAVNTAVTLDAYNILHTSGAIMHSGISGLNLINGSTWVTDGATAATSTSFRGFALKSGSSFTLNSGTIHTESGRDWMVQDAGSSLTVNGGTLTLGRNLLLSGTAGPSFTINGGVISINGTSGDIGARSIHGNTKTFNFNGGTTTVYRLDLTGAKTVFNFGGTTAGSLTATGFAGAIGANSFLNFLPGTQMTVTLSATDEWAATQWAAGKLTFNGQGVSQLGSWAAVTTTGGLGDGFRFAYDSTTETLTVTTAPSDEPPSAPTGLAAAPGIGSVSLDWTGNTEDDLASYTVYRSTSLGAIGQTLATGLTASHYTDNSVVDNTTYHYSVTALDLADKESEPSGQASARPGLVTNYTSAEIDVTGTLTGSVGSVDTNDNSYQSITEVFDGTSSLLEHVWLFNVAPAEVVTLLVEAHHSANGAGDHFVFAYSTDDVNYTDMLTVVKTADDDTAQYHVFPSGTSGTVYVRVRDADRSAGNNALDSIIIDRLVIESETSSTAPAAASEPSPADGAVDVADTPVLRWKAGRGTVSHEVYFGTTPTPDVQGTQAGTDFTPGLLLPNTTYYWSVNQINSSGTTAGPVWSFTTGDVSPRLTTGLINGVGDTWQTVTLGSTYHSPVVLASVVYADKTVAPAVARVRNASGNTLELMVQNPSGLALSGYDVHLVVVEEGVYTMAEHGVNLEAIRVLSTGTNENNNWASSKQVQVLPANTYTTPVVLGQVMSANDGKWSVFWSSSSNRSDPATASSIYVGKHVGEDTDLTRSEETLGLIIVESGVAALDGVAFTAVVGADSVGGVGDSAPYTYPLSGLSSASEVAISSAGMDGTDGGWPVLLGSASVSATQLALAIDEDQISDSERKHSSEQVSCIVFE